VEPSGGAGSATAGALSKLEWASGGFPLQEMWERIDRQYLLGKVKGMDQTQVGNVLTASFLLFLMGCGPSAESTTQIDLPIGAPVQLEGTPLTCVGVVSGDSLHEFDRVVTPFLLPDRRLVVPLAGSREIRLFSLQGEYLASLGGRGEGPGEFSSLGGAWGRGDTIESFDGDLLRVTRFLPSGEVEVVVLDRVPSAQSAVPRALSSGWIIFGVATAGIGQRDQVALNHFDRTGAHLGEVARFDGMARYDIGNFRGPDPLSPKTVFAIGGDRLYAGETLSPTLHVFGPDGSPEGEVAWDPGSSISPEIAYQRLAEEVVSRAEPSRAQEVRQRLDAFPRPDRVSVFWATIIDEEGFLWIRPFDPLQHALELGMYHRPGVGGNWLVLSPTGERLSSVSMPSGLEPSSITSDAVVGVLRDELDVESVCVYSLARQEI